MCYRTEEGLEAVASRDSDVLFEYHILRELAESESPVGAVLLRLKLSDKCGAGQATIGRKLAELDWRGYTRIVSNRGRVITEEGRRRLEELVAEIARQRDGERLVEAFRVESWERLREVLEMREALECYTARMAAERASPDLVDRMEKALDKQKDQVMQGLAGAAEDVRFHDLIAEASGNTVARYVLTVTRNQSELSPLVAAIRHRAGGRLVHEHEAILEAIRRRDPDGAEGAMRTHIRGLISDVNLFRRTHGL